MKIDDLRGLIIVCVSTSRSRFHVFLEILFVPNLYEVQPVSWSEILPICLL